MLRIAADRFVATTSSSHAAHVLAHLEFHRDTEWGGRRIALADVTEAWSVIIVAGPASRDALAGVMGSDWQPTLEALRHMEFADGAWSGPVQPGARPPRGQLRLLRASFTGELAYEIHCQGAIAAALWQALAAAGLAPFGLEALDILRVEKGYLTSSELNGQVTPQDVGLGAMLRPGKDGAVRNSIGRALLERKGLQAANRPLLVGLRGADPRSSFLGGAQLTATATDRRSQGYITSAVYSPALRQWIGLALVARDHSAIGTELIARDPLRGRSTLVRVAPAVHFDADGVRIKA
jgi:sarcosine oxidase subunit alpha